ncbi:MAG: hypothetical protein GY765_05385 [bacterium]|nr:hypothetical protein [bacterium]
MIPTLNNAFSVRAYHELHAKKPGDTFLDKMIFNARKTLINWVGRPAYTAAINTLDAIEKSEEDEEKALSFQNAEAELVMRCAVAKLNVKVSDQGVVLAAKSQQFDEAVVTLATPGQIEKMQKQYWDAALALVKEYCV